ncbi:MAG: RimK family alpha-L-glutamate ligase [Chloroflexi bacterium]|nr:RimK family alpha-L-glutamate ligase [Chloroflexota bacterium]MBP8056052.1 RimK family alpha-L-glutamate ligase [Chloroflexota bacterium]
MRIGILSRNHALYSTRRLALAARERLHQVELIDTMSVAVDMNHDAPHMKTVSRQTLPEVEGIIPRIGSSITYYGLAVVRQFEAQGVVTTASSGAIAQSRDKLHSMQIMHRAGLPTPKTVAVFSLVSLWYAIQSVGGLPVILKKVQGTQGNGVLLARDFQGAAAAFQQLHQGKEAILVQEYIPEARGRDTRIIVVGGRCVAAMERCAAEGNFRANLHQGGTAQTVTLKRETVQLAVQAAQVHELDVAGVDIIFAERGPLLLEVNASPGLEGIETVTKTDVATEIVVFLEKLQHKQSRTRGNRRKGAGK